MNCPTCGTPHASQPGDRTLKQLVSDLEMTVAMILVMVGVGGFILVRMGLDAILVLPAAGLLFNAGETWYLCRQIKARRVALAFTQPEGEGA